MARRGGRSRVGRYYDPATGQFITVDPLVDETVQPYAYAFGNPVDGTDPLGLRGCGLNPVCYGSKAVHATSNLVNCYLDGSSCWRHAEANAGVGALNAAITLTGGNAGDLLPIPFPCQPGAGFGAAALFGSLFFIPGFDEAGGVTLADGAESIGASADAGGSTLAPVTANRIAGDAFRDEVASRLETEYGFTVLATEVTIRTPLGIRRIDILAERNGELIAFETKLGNSPYLPSQRAKDWWMANGGVDVFDNGTLTPIPTVVIRGPLP